MTSTPPRAPHAKRVWARFLWAIQVVVFLGAGVFVGVFVTPIASVQNATGPVATTPQNGERVVASRGRSADRVARRARSDHDDHDGHGGHGGDGGHAPLLPCTLASTLPSVAPPDSFVLAPVAATEHAPRRIRFALHAPRGPPPLG